MTLFTNISLIICSLLYNQSTVTDIAVNNDNQNMVQMVDLMFKMNEGRRIIYDYCEVIEPDSGIFQTEERPQCLFNYSYIDTNNTINMSKINSDLRNYFITKRSDFCKRENLLCGELTILIKLLDLINGVTNIVIKDVNNPNMWLNLRIIDFENLYNLYIGSLDNIEILTNITLRRQQANIYLERERTRISKMLNQAYYERFADSVYNTIGAPVFHTVKYIGSTVGNMFGEMIDGIMVELSMEAKIIILVISVIILKKI